MLVFFNNFDNLNEFITAQVIEKQWPTMPKAGPRFITAQVIEKLRSGSPSNDAAFITAQVIEKN